MNKHLFFLLFPCSFFYCSCFAQDKTDTSINVFLITNSFELNTTQFGTIKDFLSVCPIITHITGYADSTGTATYNLALSKRRAYAVYNVIKANVDSINNNIVAFNGESEDYQSQFDSTHLRDLYLLSKLRAKAVYDYLLERRKKKEHACAGNHYEKIIMMET